MEGGGRGLSGWGARVHPWWIHVDVWQKQYNIVKLKKKKTTIKQSAIKKKKTFNSKLNYFLEIIYLLPKAIALTVE